MAVLPSEVPTGLVTGQFYFVNEDNVDAGTDPDLTVVTGKVTFTCSAKVLRMPTKLATVIPLVFDAEFNSSGELVPKGLPTQIGLKLPATNSALFNPTDFTWKVEFDIKDAATNFTVQIPSFDIQVPSGGTVDLTSAMPVDTSPGTITIQGPAGTPGGLSEWKPNTYYGSTTWALSPNGTPMVANVNHTSASSFTNEVSKWNFRNGEDRGYLPLGTDFDTMKHGWEGRWTIPSITYANSYVNWPEHLFARMPGFFWVDGHDNFQGSSIIYKHTLATYGNPNTGGDREATRITVSAAAWNPWKDPYAQPQVSIVETKDWGLSNQALRDAFIRRRGGRIGTNGKAALAFRLDHGAVGARTYVLPKAIERDIPMSYCINPGASRLNGSEDTGITWDEYRTWALEHGWEFNNHGMDHIDATTTEQFQVQLVDSKAIIETEMVNIQPIEIFSIPGVGGTNMNGWTSTNTPEHFGDKFEAGRFVMGNYAFSTGHIPGLYRHLDGSPASGELHKTIDAMTVQEIKDTVIAAQKLGAGICLMLHPSAINDPDRITEAQLHEVMDWIADERDAGRLEILTMGGLILADKYTDYRHNLVLNPNFNTFEGYTNTTGWSSSSGYATSTNTAGTMLYAIDITNQKFFAGATRCFTAKFTNPAAAGGANVTARMQITNTATGLNTTRDIVLAPGESKIVRRYLKVGLAAGIVNFYVGRASGGVLRVENVGALAT